MKSKDIKGIRNDLLDLRIWRNPITKIITKNKYKIDLITGKVNIISEDDVTKLLKEKQAWSIDRIKNLKGKLEEFKKAEIKIFLKKEKVLIEYKNKKFEKEKIY